MTNTFQPRGEYQFFYVSGGPRTKRENGERDSLTRARYEKEVTKLTSEGKVQVMTGPFDLT